MHSLKTWLARERTATGLAAGEPELSDRELLARLFRDSRPAASILAAASLQEVLSLERRQLASLPAVGRARIEQLFAAIELGARFASAKEAGLREPTISCSRDAFDLVSRQIMNLEVEHFLVINLDGKHRAMSVRTVSQGTRTECLVHPREAFCWAVRERAVAVLAAHNHSSGSPHPSRQDLDLTAKLHRAGQLLGIPLLDHLIIGHETYVSMADIGFLEHFPPPSVEPTSCANREDSYDCKKNRSVKNNNRKRRKSK